MNKLILGWHTVIQPSINSGINIIKNTHEKNKSNYEVGVQIFLKTPMRVCKSKFTEEDCNIVKKYIEEKNIFLVVHGQYLINFIKEDINWAIQSVVDDIQMLNKMIPENKKKETGVIIHMGKNVNKDSVEKCIENFYKNVKIVIEKTKECDVKLILETSTKAKNGNDIFYNIETFGKLKNYLKTNLKDEEYKRIGYCIDTAHIFASGYDIKTKETFENFISLWDHYIGLNEITLFHLNDSKENLGCCRDLHEQIGLGFIYKNDVSGLQSLLEFCKQNKIPIIIESGGNQDEEINFIKKLIN